MDKIVFLYTLSNAMTVDSGKRKSQLSPLKYGYFKSRVAYFLMVVLNLKEILLLSRKNYDQLKFLRKFHPEALPSVFWPYQCASWGMVKRLESLHDHFTLVGEGISYLRLARYERKEVIDLDEYYPGMRLVLNKDGLFLREGMLVLNIYVRQERLFSIAFSLSKSQSGRLVAFVGAIQGRRMNHVTDIYRDITKKLYGVRPRDLMVELFQMFCKQLGIDWIYAIQGAEHQHYHYFYLLKNKSEMKSLDYDQVWEERGGHCCQDGFYKLSVRPARKPYHLIVARKRSMYRKRYEVLTAIEEQMSIAIDRQQGLF
ncbi:MAG: VirK/YbjX family protein [Candidatus Thiodiazotropha taylori]|nr:VirK/YbjX family protein [Candidatus Thiodiazotropha taylori]